MVFCCYPGARGPYSSQACELLEARVHSMASRGFLRRMYEAGVDLLLRKEHVGVDHLGNRYYRCVRVCMSCMWQQRG